MPTTLSVKCVECGRVVSLRNDGLLRMHTPTGLSAGPTCPGSRAFPRSDDHQYAKNQRRR